MTQPMDPSGQGPVDPGVPGLGQQQQQYGQQQQFDPQQQEIQQQQQEPEQPSREYCEFFYDQRCDQLSCIEIFGLANDVEGKPVAVLIGRMAPDATTQDIIKDFGGGRFELKAIGKSKGGDAPYTKIRGIHLAGEETWKANVPGLEDPRVAAGRTGALPGVAPPGGYGAAPYGYGAPQHPAAPYGGAPPGYPPGYGGVPPYGAAPPYGGGYGAPQGFRPPYPAGFGGYGGFGQQQGQQPGIVPIPTGGGVAPGLPPQQVQQVVEREMEERRHREDAREAAAAAERATNSTMSLVATVGNMFKGDQGNSGQQVQFYVQEVARKNTEMEQMRQTLQLQIQAQTNRIWELQQQLVTAQQNSQAQLLQVQQEKVSMQGEIASLQMRLQMGNPGGQPSGMTLVAQQAVPMFIGKAMENPRIGNAIGAILEGFAGAPGAPGASPGLPAGK